MEGGESGDTPTDVGNRVYAGRTDRRRGVVEVWKAGPADCRGRLLCFCTLVYYIVNKLKVHIKQTRELFLLIGRITVR